MLLGASWLSVDDTFDLRLCRHPSKPTQPLRPCEGASVDVLSKEAEHGKKRTRKAGRLFFIKKELMLAIYRYSTLTDHVRTPAALASLPDTVVMP